MKYLLFDTSVWVALIRSENKEKIINKITNKNRIILTHEVFIELMNIDENTKMERINFLANIQDLKCLNFNNKYHQGTLTDLRTYEINYLISKNPLSKKEYIYSNIETINPENITNYKYMPSMILSEFLNTFSRNSISLSIPSWEYYDDPKKYRKSKAIDTPIYIKGKKS